MRSFARVLALLTLFGWLFAAGHVALEHGGTADGGAWETLVTAVTGHHHAHDDADNHAEPAVSTSAPSGQDRQHHHELAGVDSGVTLRLVEKISLEPVLWPLLMLCGELGNGWSPEDEAAGAEQVWEHAPPDERASGWLLVCHTALPVRGPSLEA